MRTRYDCIPCFIRQALESARLVTKDESVQERLLRCVLSSASEMNMNDTPPAMARFIHKTLREMTGIHDPYINLKVRSNELALGLYHELKTIIEQSNSPFETAVRLAIAGNIIDFGVSTVFSEDKVQASIDDALKANLDPYIIKTFNAEIQQAGSILYLADNAGEIVFDRLLIEQMPLEKVVVAVKGYPIINDATMDDAIASGITDIVEVVDNGADAPGTILEICSPKFVKMFQQSDLIISKGQGNFETLSDINANIFFLFRAKCPPIAEYARVPVGSMVLFHNEPKPSE